jgi:DNA-binding transcriptional MerR regulator
MGRKTDYHLIEEIRKIASRGKTRIEVAEELGISYDGVRYYASRYNIPIEAGGKKRKSGKEGTRLGKIKSRLEILRREKSSLEERIRREEKRLEKYLEVGRQIEKAIDEIVYEGKIPSLREIGRRIGKSHERARGYIIERGLYAYYAEIKEQMKKRGSCRKRRQNQAEGK